MAEAISAAEEEGASVFAYVNALWGNQDMFKSNPEWAQRKRDGKICSFDGKSYTSIAMCPNTAYRDYLLEIVKEIATNYRIGGFYFDEPCFTGWCNCPNCREKFEKDTGQEIPLEVDWDEPRWCQFVKWRREQINDFKNDLYMKVKNTRKTAEVTFQHPFPLSFVSDLMVEQSEKTEEKSEEIGGRWSPIYRNWHLPTVYGADLENTASLEDIVHMELYRRSVSRPIWWYGVCCRLANSVAPEKPKMILNMEGQSPFDLSPLPDNEIKISIGEIVANNASPLFALYYPDIRREKGWDIVKKCYSQLEDKQEYLQGLQRLKHIAVFFSHSTVRRFDSMVDQPSHTNDLLGVSEALLRENIPFDIILSRELEDELNGYKGLVLPNVKCLSDGGMKSIKDFVERGGGLLVTGQTGFFNRNGRLREVSRLKDIVGFDKTEEVRIPESFDSYMKIKSDHPVTKGIPKGEMIPSYGVYQSVQPKDDANTLARLVKESPAHYAPLGKETEIPALLSHDLLAGGGKVVYIPTSFGEQYLQFGVEDHKNIIANSVRWMGGKSPVRVENCPETMELTTYRQGKDKIIVHLVKSIRNEKIRPIPTTPRVSNIKLKVDKGKVNQEEGKIIFPTTRDLSKDAEGNYLIFDLPKVKEHTIISIGGG